MKKAWIFLLMFFVLTAGFSQEEAKNDSKEKKKFASGITLYNDLWQGSADQWSPRFLNQGLDAFLMYTIPVERSPLLFCIGTGIGSHNLYHDSFLLLDSNNTYYFSKVGNFTDTAGNVLEAKKSKINVTYWDFPFEFRYEAAKGLRFGVGMKFGFVVSSSTKYKGDDPAGSGNSVKIKSKDLKSLERWRYGFTGVIGYKSVELYGFYSLVKLFREGKGPEIFPVSVGVRIRPIFLN